MGGQKLTVPMLIVCQRTGCGRVKAVKNRAVQRRQRYCSLSCAMKVSASRPAWKAAVAKRVMARAANRRAAILPLIADMTPLDAFRVGYLKGLESRRRQQITARRRQALQGLACEN